MESMRVQTATRASKSAAIAAADANDLEANRGMLVLLMSDLRMLPGDSTSIWPGKLAHHQLPSSLIIDSASASALAHDPIASGRGTSDER
jgi:hypothetical protein